MHLLNCLLLKLYKHCRRSHCCCAPSPSASLYNERQGKRAHEKFRGHCVDGMLDGPLFSSLRPTWTACVEPFLCGMEPDLKRRRKGTSEPLPARAFTNILVYFLFWEQVLMLRCVLWKLKSVHLMKAFGLKRVLLRQCHEAEITEDAHQVRFTQYSDLTSKSKGAKIFTQQRSAAHSTAW